jgi:hypothetical protein
MPRMKNTSYAAVIVFAILATAHNASAGGVAGSIGVGAEFEIRGAGGLSANYDAGKFHVGGFLGYFNPAGDNNTEIDFGGRFFFHLASTASSDFGIGGILGIQNVPNGNDRQSILIIEPGFQIRTFVVPNVALSFTVGMEIGSAVSGPSSDELNITGNIVGQGGIHYYF